MADPLLPIEVQIREKLRLSLVGLKFDELRDRMRAGHLTFRGLGKKAIALALVQMYVEKALVAYGEDHLDLYRELLVDLEKHPDSLVDRAQKAWIVIAPDDTPDRVRVEVARAEACQCLVWETFLANWIEANVKIQVAGG